MAFSVKLYDDPLQRLQALQPFEQTGMKPGLERIHALLDALGNPESQLRIIHVGGTNGKGSVSAMVASILRASGRRVGLYTSPHLLAYNERIRVDGVPIPYPDLLRWAGRLVPLLEPGAGIHPTYFEATTALALGYLAERQVDAAVLEVGLGGRLDATTVGSPELSVLTAISHDHQAVLGDRLDQIAAEKAAIIRGGVALTTLQSREVAAVIRGRAEEVGVPLWEAGRDFTWQVKRNDLGGQIMDISGVGWGQRDLFLPLLGTFQGANAALAVAAIQALQSRGWSLPPHAVRDGLAGVRWAGRFQVERGAQWMVLDGAHNPAGAQALCASLSHYFPSHRHCLALGILRDKDKAGILKALAPVAHEWILTASSNPRATDPHELALHLPATEAPVVLAPTVGEALRLAREGGGRRRVVVVSGSLFTVADALACLKLPA